MKYPKMRELKEAIISLISPAYTTKFPLENHHPFRGYRGKPVVNEEHCVGCETCANVCPSHAITFTDDTEKKVRIMTRDYGRCIFCGQCEEHCITGSGVKLSDELYDLATFDRSSLVEFQERELIICENCGAIITTKDHIRFLHEQLGPRAYSNILNISMLNERLKLADVEDTHVEVKDELKRKDMFNTLCPNCLRKVQVKILSP
jgi:hydrogenase-4 component H